MTWSRASSSSGDSSISVKLADTGDQVVGVGDYHRLCYGPMTTAKTLTSDFDRHPHSTGPLPGAEHTVFDWGPDHRFLDRVWAALKAAAVDGAGRP